jgi:transcriptional regulator with XRE-family HTH domain
MVPELIVLGKNIREARRSLGYSQEKLADMAHLHRTYICDIERGARNVTVVSLLKLAQSLGTTVSELTRGIGDGSSAPESNAALVNGSPKLCASLPHHGSVAVGMR